MHPFSSGRRLPQVSSNCWSSASTGIGSLRRSSAFGLWFDQSNAGGAASVGMDEGRRGMEEYSSSYISLGSGDSCVTTNPPVEESSITKRVERCQKTNPYIKYSDVVMPKRFLTEPSIGVLNDGHDNEHSHLILYVNLILYSGSKQRYIVKDLLGTGTFAQVAKCFDMETNSFVAIKIIKNLPQYRQHAQLERQYLSILNGIFDPNDEHHIVRMRDSFFFLDHFCISFELLGPSLRRYITSNNNNGLTLSDVAIVCRQILDALTITGDAGIIHCDLKPDNIVVDTTKQSLTVKVIDFGIAQFTNERIYTYIQTRNYRSPEVIIGYPYANSIDMWSLGCIVAELFLGSPLFLGASEYDVLKMMTEILGCQPPDHLLRYGTKTSCFFKQNGSMYQFQNYQSTSKHNNCSAYRLLEDVDFELRGLTKPRRRHFFPVKLEDMIHNHYIRKTILEERSCKDNELLLALMDLLRGLLEFDPAKRLTPLQALQHPFVTGLPFVTQYQHFPETPPIVHLGPQFIYEAESPSFTYFAHPVSHAAGG
ncbi:serine/threonine-protein kinase ppk15-like isoform X3 [Canna indica]|uniref:Serine/threonine-protein kinase ppk15-like isoform X3 n=1 Tax=Canna indica TaxID=4628 RepID=A0AAQ3JSF3_9LILI|nr:serine/threonine-protein kinase ppk15-like isoform X3 [Canna indica]